MKKRLLKSVLASGLLGFLSTGQVAAAEVKKSVAPASVAKVDKLDMISLANATTIQQIYWAFRIALDTVSSGDGDVTDLAGSYPSCRARHIEVIREVSARAVTPLGIYRILTRINRNRVHVWALGFFMR